MRRTNPKATPAHVPGCRMGGISLSSSAAGQEPHPQINICEPRLPSIPRLHAKAQVIDYTPDHNYLPGGELQPNWLAMSQITSCPRLQAAPLPCSAWKMLHGLISPEVLRCSHKSNGESYYCYMIHSLPCCISWAQLTDLPLFLSVSSGAYGCPSSI